MGFGIHPTRHATFDVIVEYHFWAMIDKHKKKPNAHVTNERTNKFAYHKDDVYAKLSRRLFNVRVKICKLRNLMQCLWVTTICM